nr:hypothetical protein [Bacteroides intestinalis]
MLCHFLLFFDTSKWKIVFSLPFGRVHGKTLAGIVPSEFLPSDNRFSLSIDGDSLGYWNFTIYFADGTFLKEYMV